MTQELKIIVREDGTATVTGKLDKLNKSMAGVQKTTNTLGIAFSSMVKTMFGIGSAIAAVGTGIKVAGQALNAFNAQVMALKEVQAVINSTGRASEFTAQSLNALAGELQKVSNFGDDEIMAKATLSLLKFTSITKQDFPRALQLVIDMSKSMGGLEAAAKAVGIALDKPEIGITRLRRAGVTFTQQQEEMIKAFVETGKQAEAQAIIFTALEGKYADQALAGVSVSTQLKAAWGDYLETLGGSLSVMDGVKKGLAVYFLGIANDSKNLSDEQIKHVYDVQKQWAKAVLEISERGKQSITILGGVAISAFGLLQDFANAVYFSFKNVTSGLVSIYNGLGKVAPRIMETITGVSTFGEALENLKDDFSSGMKDMAGIESFGAQTQKNIKNWTALFDNANNKVKAGKQEIDKFYESQKKLLDTGVMPEGQSAETEGTPAGQAGKDNFAQLAKYAQEYTDQILQLNNTELENIAQKYSQMREQVKAFYADNLISKEQLINSLNAINEQELSDVKEYNAKIEEANVASLNAQLKADQEAADAAKKLVNDKLSAQLAYLQAVKPLSQESLEAQLKAYESELQAYLDLGLSKIQIDEMVAKRRAEIETESEKTIASERNRLAQQAYQSFQNVVNNLLSLSEQRKQKELDNIEETAERENWTNDRRLAAKKEINKKYEAEERRLHMVQRIMSIAQAVINTAEGVTAALKLGPTGIPLAVLIGALGTVEVATIAAQKFAKGGLFRGIGGGQDDRNLIAVSNGEYIINAEATRQYKPVLDAINYGYRNIAKTQQTSFADGGMVNFATKDSSIPILNMLNDNISGLRKDLASNGLSLKGSDGIPLMKFISRAASNYRSA